jgi:peptide/nickel transport system substrate-binding protein
MQRWIKTDSRAKKWFVGLTSLTATDTHTVDFEFSQPFGVLTNYLAAPSSAIIPAADAEAAGDGTLQPSQLIGTGPFKLASWNPGVKVVLKRYSGYQSPSGSPSGYAGTKKAYVNELDFIPVADASARLAGLQAGEYEYAESIPGDQESVLKGSGFLEAPRVVGPVTAFLNAHSQILTPAVREAILSSIDMGSVGKALGPSDLWSLSPALAPPGGALASSAGTANWNKPNVANAKQLLASAGYNGAELTMITTSSPATYAMAIVLQQDLQNIGMKVKLQEMETAAMQARRAGATGWDIAMGQLNRAADGTQQSALYCGNTNGGYCSDQMNSLISQYQQATTPTAQKSAHDKIQELYYQDLPFIMGPDLSDLAGVSPKLKGFTPTGLPLPHFWNSWLNS